MQWLCSIAWKANSCMMFYSLPSDVDCGVLPNVMNGLISFDRTNFGSEANYSCDIGYDLIGNRSRFCLANGEWTGIQPQCERKYIVPIQWNLRYWTL